VWFRLNIGRSQNADPRWILPLICRRGHITKNEVGAIRIGPNETQFEIPRGTASRFMSAFVRSADEDDGVAIEPVAGNGPPPQSRGGPRPGGQGGPRQHRPANHQAVRRR
jgi:ATP-dependent RNA helicase DeaD